MVDIQYGILIVSSLPRNIKFTSCLPKSKNIAKNAKITCRESFRLEKLFLDLLCIISSSHKPRSRWLWVAVSSGSTSDGTAVDKVPRKTRKLGYKSWKVSLQSKKKRERNVTMVIWPCSSAQSLFRLRSLCSMSTGGVDLSDDAEILENLKWLWAHPTEYFSTVQKVCFLTCSSKFAKNRFHRAIFEL